MREQNPINRKLEYRHIANNVISRVINIKSCKHWLTPRPGVAGLDSL